MRKKLSEGRSSQFTNPSAASASSAPSSKMSRKSGVTKSGSKPTSNKKTSKSKADQLAGLDIDIDPETDDATLTGGHLSPGVCPGSRASLHSQASSLASGISNLEFRQRSRPPSRRYSLSSLSDVDSRYSALSAQEQRYGIMTDETYLREMQLIEDEKSALQRLLSLAKADDETSALRQEIDTVNERRVTRESQRLFARFDAMIQEAARAKKFIPSFHRRPDFTELLSDRSAEDVADSELRVWTDKFIHQYVRRPGSVSADTQTGVVATSSSAWNHATPQSGKQPHSQTRTQTQAQHASTTVLVQVGTSNGLAFMPAVVKNQRLWSISPDGSLTPWNSRSPVASTLNANPTNSRAVSAFQPSSSTQHGRGAGVRQVAGPGTHVRGQAQAHADVPQSSSAGSQSLTWEAPRRPIDGPPPAPK